MGPAVAAGFQIVIAVGIRSAAASFRSGTGSAASCPFAAAGGTVGSAVGSSQPNSALEERAAVLTAASFRSTVVAMEEHQRSLVESSSGAPREDAAEEVEEEASSVPCFEEAEGVVSTAVGSRSVGEPAVLAGPAARRNLE